MAIDMSQFFQIFYEETEEHLAGMEALLLALDVAHPDAEQLNAIFRAAHSIKGSAGTFGFTDLAQVTHVLESLLDRIRKGELALREEMIDAFLAAGDVLKAMLAAHKGEGAADAAAAQAICARLDGLTAKASAPAPAAAPGPLPAAPEPRPPAAGLDVRFVLDGDATASPRLFDNLHRELAAFGEVRVVERAAAAGLPWHIELPAGDDAEAVRAALEFVARSDSIRIAPLGAPDVAATDDAYGFFVDLPEPAAVEEAYGFFDAPAAAAPAEPKAPAAAAPASADASIRVGIEKVDQLINLVGELVITQAMLTEAAAVLDPARFERLGNGLVQLERNTRDIQQAVMSIRMLPVSMVFSRFPRLVRELSQKFGKKVELQTLGEETELDKGLVERIADPLTHLVRNSLDHGIETPEERAARGKPESGTLTLKAYHQSGNVVIEVDDDGAGLNRAKILAKARERGLPVAEQMSDQDVWALIFEAGFSTAERITEVSGRGVGMDVVRRNIGALGGRVEIQSQDGAGTRITVKLPLTLAILDGMSVAVGRETYIAPLGSVVESLQAERSMLKSVSGVARLLQLRDEYLPVIPLHEVFGVPGAVAAFDRGIMVILEADGAKAALFVDAIVGQQQVVIKSLETNYRKVAGIAGATIMGDGRVALILDVAALVGMARSALPAAA